MTDQTCTYTLEPHCNRSDSPTNFDEEITSTDEESTADEHWECPHPVYEDGRCVFHSPPDQVESAEVHEALIDCLTDESRVPAFRGAQFEELLLTDTTLERSDGAAIDFSYAIVEGETDLSEATVDTDLCFESATLRDGFDLSSGTVSGELDCSDAKFGDRVFLDDATFGGPVSFDHVEGGFISANGATFESDATFAYSSWTANAAFATSVFKREFDLERSCFRRKLDLTRIDVGGSTILAAITVGGETLLNAAQLQDDLVLRRGQFGDDVDLDHTSVAGALTGDRSTFEGTVTFESGSCGDGDGVGDATFEASQFEGLVHASEATFHGDLDCRGAVFDDNVWFVLADIEGSVDFRDATFHAGSPGAQSGVHFREVTFGGPALFSDAEFEDQSFFFNAEFEADADFTNTSFRHFQFGGTVAGETRFTDAAFNERAIFSNSTFEGPAQFDSATFEYSADFSGAVFGSNADFYRTTFVREIDFEDAEFDSQPVSQNVDLQLEVDDPLRHTGETFDLTGVSDDLTLELQFDGDHSGLTEDNPIRAVNAKIDLVQMANRRAGALLGDPLELMQAAADELPEEDAYYLIGVHLSKESTEKHDPDDEFPVIITDAMLFAAFTCDDKHVSIAHMATDVERINYVIPIQPERHPELFEDGIDEMAGGHFRAALLETLDRRVELMSDDEQQYLYEMMRPIIIGTSAYQELN